MVLFLKDLRTILTHLSRQAFTHFFNFSKIRKVVFEVAPKRYVKQDHQRWRYSTVIHLEQFVYLAVLKDLNKEKRKEQRNMI